MTTTTTATAHTGSRIALPPNALKVCASCAAPRGNRTAGWARITDRQEVTVGWTCPDCPTAAEPIRRRPSGRFYGVVGVRGRDGKRRQLSRTHDTLEAARAWVEEVRSGAAAAAADGRSYLDRTRVTVTQLAEAWLTTSAKGKVRAGEMRGVTLRGYEVALAPLLHYLGDRVARDVLTEDVNEALRAMASPDPDRAGSGGSLSHRSRSYALTTLRQVFQYGVNKRWISENPARTAYVGGSAAPTRRAQRWDPEELADFLSHVEDAYSGEPRYASEPWVPVAMALAACGLRRSEVAGLQWEYVNMDAGTVEVAASRVAISGGKTETGKPKSDLSARVVDVEELQEGTTAELRRLWMRQGQPERGFVLLNSIGQRVHPDTVSKRFKSLCREAGVRYPGSIHNLRHTLATMFVQEGVTAEKGAALLGHDVATYLKFYVVTRQQDGAEAAKLGGERMRRARAEARARRAL